MAGLRETKFIAGLCLALIFVIWVAVAALMERARRDAIEEGYREAYTSASVFAEQATPTIRLLDSISQLVAHDLAKSPSPTRLKELVDEKAITMDALVLLSFIDADGRTVSSNKGPDPNRTDLSDREHIRVQLDHKVDGLYIGKPVLGRVSGRWSIQLSRRVEDKAGDTLGVLVVSIDPHYFERFWRRVADPSRAIAELVGLDGVLRARSIDVESALASNTRRDAIARAASVEPSGRLETRGEDGRPELTEFVRLEGLPLVVTAGVSKAQALAQIDLAVESYVAIGIAMTAIIGIFGAVLMRFAARLNMNIDKAQRAERRLIDAIEAIPEGFALFDADDRLVICNNAYLETYATTADKIRPGIRFEDLLRVGLDRGQYRAAEGKEDEWLQARLAQHREPSGRLEQIIDSGRWLRIEEKKTSDGGVVGIRADITELKQRQLDFARQAAMLEMTLQSIDGAIATFDSDRKLVAWNDNFHRVFRNDALPEELFRVGASFDDMMRVYAERGGFGRRSPQDAVARMIEDFHNPESTSTMRRLADGRAIETRRNPTPDGGAVFVFRDVSERADYERRMSEARRAAEAANRLKSEFLAMMSHEIRTPMNAIIGMSSVLAERNLDPTEKRYVDVIAESGEKLLVIIDDLLELSSLEAGKLVLSESVFDPRRVVAGAVEIASALPHAKSLSIVVEIDPDVPASLVADAGRISQILLNLVSNAVKYTPTGSVKIRLSSTGLTTQTIKLFCVVEDTGPGIPEALRAGLFKPFVRGASAVEKNISGTGLGLAICQRLVDLMGGAIGAESRAGEGSRFWFEIPCRADDSSDAKSPTPSALANRERRLRVLVAEDVPANQTVIAAMLSSLGHDADIVDDGAAAISAAMKTDYNVILMDLQMPNVGGLDATRTIRSQVGRNRMTPIIAVTAFAYQDDKDSARQAGASDYLTKPIRKSKLNEALRAISAGTEGEMDNNTTQAEFDESAVTELREDLGPESFGRLIATCIDDVRRRIDALDSLAGSEATRGLAHQLRGLFAQFGAVQAAQAAAATELSDEHSFTENLQRLKQYAARALEKFKTIRDAEVPSES